MVFIIQQSQNKDTTAIQLKLNELIACNARASNRLIDIEDLTDEELQVLKKFYIHLSKISAKEDTNLYSTHSIDEANKLQEIKNKTHKYDGNKIYHRKKKVKQAPTKEKNGTRRNPINT
jgi:low affinity Fe/Cu permease